MAGESYGGADRDRREDLPKCKQVSMESMGEPATTRLTTTPNVVLLPASSDDVDKHRDDVGGDAGELLHKEVDPGGDFDVQVQHPDDVDKQRLLWEAADQERQVWDSIDDQRKLKKKEERRKKQEERRKRQDNKKKRKLEVEDTRKKLAKIRDSKMARSEGRGSPSTTKFSPSVSRSPKLPLVRSPALNVLRSRLGLLASAGASKRRRSLSDRDESSPSQKRAKSTVRSPSTSRSPSLPSQKTVHSRGRKVRRLTSAVWKDFIPHYDGGKLVEAECKHCNEFLPATRDVEQPGTAETKLHCRDVTRTV